MIGCIPLIFHQLSVRSILSVHMSTQSAAAPRRKASRPPCPWRSAGLARPSYQRLGVHSHLHSEKARLHFDCNLFTKLLWNSMFKSFERYQFDSGSFDFACSRQTSRRLPSSSVHSQLCLLASSLSTHVRSY